MATVFNLPPERSFLTDVLEGMQATLPYVLKQKEEAREREWRSTEAAKAREHESLLAQLLREENKRQFEQKMAFDEQRHKDEMAWKETVFNSDQKLKELELDIQRENLNLNKFNIASAKYMAALQMFKGMVKVNPELRDNANNVLRGMAKDVFGETVEIPENADVLGLEAITKDEMIGQLNKMKDSNPEGYQRMLSFGQDIGFFTETDAAKTKREIKEAPEILEKVTKPALAAQAEKEKDVTAHRIAEETKKEKELLPLKTAAEIKVANAKAKEGETLYNGVKLSVLKNKFGEYNIQRLKNAPVDMNKMVKEDPQMAKVMMILGKNGANLPELTFEQFATYYTTGSYAKAAQTAAGATPTQGAGAWAINKYLKGAKQ